ncbi:MAG: histidinol dehydrogenase [Victivallaceae bacterium]|nr:histidinol dehydrogenase [Victivallaceae bacterium]
MKTISFRDPDFEEQLEALYNRPSYPAEIEAQAAAIIDAVKKDGDSALAGFALKFDHVKLTPEQFKVPQGEIDAAAGQLTRREKSAINTALRNVRAFAKLTVPKGWTASPRPGVTVGEKFEPLDRVGVYIPGGTAPLVSTVIHTAGIAGAVGVKEIAAATPARKDGSVHPAVLYAMKQAGVTEVYRLGGVYGVAALALGTATVPKVEKLVGPGNAYVTAAKKLLYGRVAIDMVAGPSEVMVVTDGSGRSDFAAADLLSQAEHGSGLEQAVLVSTDADMLEAVKAEFMRQKMSLPRVATVDRVMDKGLFFILARDLEQAAAIASKYAPEHLELQVKNPERMARRVTAAGAIFLGGWTPEPIGDFCAGPSHVLPTASSARYFNGLDTPGFFRRSSIVRYTEAAMRREAGVVECFGEMEGLAAHGRAGTIRRK